MTPVLAVLLAIAILGERVRGPQLLGLAAIVVGISLMYRVHANLSAGSLWLLLKDHRKHFPKWYGREFERQIGYSCWPL